MAWIQARLNRLRQLVAICIKKGLTPSSVGFADLVLNYSCSEFGVSMSTAKDYLKTLVGAWRYNKWKSYVKHNHYLTKEEQKRWLSQI